MIPHDNHHRLPNFLSLLRPRHLVAIIGSVLMAATTPAVAQIGGWGSLPSAVGNDAAGNPIIGPINATTPTGAIVADSTMNYGVNGLGNIDVNAPPNAVACYDMLFSVRITANNGTPNVLNLTQNIFNNTGVDWDDFHLTLGTGSGAGFVPSNIEGLRFGAYGNGTVARGSSPQMGNPAAATSTNSMDFAGGPISGNDGLLKIQTGIFIPDSMVGVNGIANFTVRMYPTNSSVIPTPGSAALLAVGGLVATKRRRC